MSESERWEKVARDAIENTRRAVAVSQQALAERDAARLELNEATERARALEYAAGYAADLAAIDRVLDQHDAPHDCEDGVSLSPKRIRLLAEERDAARLELRALEWLVVKGYPHWISCDDTTRIVHGHTGPDWQTVARALGWEG